MLTRSITRRFPLSPESELLVWCARTVVSDDLKGSIRSRAQQQVDWAVVLRMAQYHGVVPLLYKNLSAFCSDLVPAELFARLRQKAQAGALLNRSLAHELVTLCDALAKHGVSVIPIKGVTLALSAYGDLGLRDFTDLDLLIPEGSIAEARKVIVSQGYETNTNGVEVNRVQDDEGPYHVFVKKRALSRVDLQWVMAHQYFLFRLDRPEFWQHRITVATENKTIPGLAPEELLIVLCVHGSKHAWGLLKWVCDVAELLRSHPDLDWERCFASATKWRCRRMLEIGVSIAHLLLDAPLPKSVKEKVEADSDLQTLSHRMPASLLVDRQEGITEEQAGALYFSLKDSWRERWSLGLLLCRAHSPMAANPPSWLRWRTSLSCFARLVIPLHRVMKNLLSSTIRGTLNRWVPHSS